MKIPLNNQIKHLLYFSLLVFAFSCSKKNDATPNTPSIVGKWLFVSGVNLSDNSSYSNCYQGSTQIFKLDNTFSLYSNCNSTTYSGTYKLAGTNLSVTITTPSTAVIDYSKSTSISSLTETQLIVESVLYDGRKTKEVYKRGN